MAENEISDYFETDSSNVDISGVPVTENVMKPSNVNNGFRALQGALKRWFKSSLFRLRDSADQTKLLAFDLSGLTTATIRTLAVPDKSGTVALVGDVAGKLDVRRNRIVNGDMRVSQENGTTSGTTNGFYPVDQWAQYRVTSAATLTVAQVASVTPAGSPNRLRATVTVADASLAAGEFWTLTQNLEGSNVADFQWGSAAGKQVVLRFGFKGPAGTYAVSIQNYNAGTPNRSYVALFTITAPQANTDTVQTIAVSASTTGTWGTADGVIGATLNIVLASGSTFQGAAGWNNSNVYGTSAVSNGMATAGAVFELFDVGLRLDPDATGVYGAYEVGEVDAKFYPERYYWASPSIGMIGFASGTDTVRFATILPVRLCKTSIAVLKASTITINTVDGATATASSPVLVPSNAASSGVQFRVSGFTGLTAFRAYYLFDTEGAVAVPARLS